MSQPGLLRNPMSDWFDYVYTYFFHPVSNLQHAFSPTINFGCNVEDAPTEQYVVNSVGSYGKQLNRVIDALSALIEHPQFQQLDLRSDKKIDAFMKLAEDADNAARQFQGQASESAVAQLLAGMHALREAEPALYERLKARLLAEV